MSVTEGPLTVAFQGELGAFSEEAALSYFDRAVELQPRRTFREVGSAVVSGDVQYGLLPVENTLAGSVVGSYDVLAAYRLKVVGEVIHRIHHCLLGVADAKIGDLKKALSHPVALAQCEVFFREFGWIEPIAVYDTAGAAREVQRLGDPSVGAVASRSAAARYGLDVVKDGIQDRDDNQTRFLVVIPEGAETDAPSAGGVYKTLIVFETANEPGALVKVLERFAVHGLNLSKIESRPAEEPWTYRFFAEVEADWHEDDVMEAFKRVQERTQSFKILGSFTPWSF